MAEQRSSSAPFAMSASTPAVAAAPTPAPILATCAAVPPTPALPSDNEEDPTGFLDELFHEFNEFNAVMNTTNGEQTNLEDKNPPTKAYVSQNVSDPVSHKASDSTASSIDPAVSVGQIGQRVGNASAGYAGQRSRGSTIAPNAGQLVSGEIPSAVRFENQAIFRVRLLVNYIFLVAEISYFHR